MRMALLPLPAILALAAALPSCGGAPKQGPEPAERPAPLVVLRTGDPAPEGARAVARVEVVSTPEARRLGLMGRDLLAPDSGMLFVYPDEAPRTFWMRNCRYPLAAAFLDAAGRILNIREMAPDDGSPEESLPRYESEGPARFVLEMESGWFARKGIRAGDRADLAGALRGTVVR